MHKQIQVHNLQQLSKRSKELQQLQRQSLNRGLRHSWAAILVNAFESPSTEEEEAEEETTTFARWRWPSPRARRVRHSSTFFKKKRYLQKGTLQTFQRLRKGEVAVAPFRGRCCRTACNCRAWMVVNDYTKKCEKKEAELIGNASTRHYFHLYF